MGTLAGQPANGHPTSISPWDRSISGCRALEAAVYVGRNRHLSFKGLVGRNGQWAKSPASSSSEHHHQASADHRRRPHIIIIRPPIITISAHTMRKEHAYAALEHS